MIVMKSVNFSGRVKICGTLGRRFQSEELKGS